MNVDFDTFEKSQRALKDYMHYKAGNGWMHEARVLISSGGQLKYSDEMTVIPRIETNKSTVTITTTGIGFDGDYYSEYSNEYQEFAFVNGTLRIKGKDRWGNPIELNITAL